VVGRLVSGRETIIIIIKNLSLSIQSNPQHGSRIEPKRRGKKRRKKKKEKEKKKKKKKKI